MNQAKRLKALEVAITNEMRERKFYLKCAERTRNALGRVMFQQIADDEMEHYRSLKDLQEKRTVHEGLPETLPLQVRETDLTDILKDVIKEMDGVPQLDADELTAIQNAIEFEAKGAAFYAKLRDEVKDEKEKALFDLLSKMEKEHCRVLKETEAYLTSPELWFKEE